MRALLLIPLLLAACGPSRPPLPPPEPEPPEVVECRREARADPEMRAPFRAASPNAPWQADEQRRAIEARLVRDCLERKGIVRGGVAPVERWR